MSFGAPAYLWLLLAPALAMLALALWLRWRALARVRLGAGARGAGKAVPPLILVAAAAIAVLAAARPQIGHDRTAVEDRGIDLVVVLDVSHSMLAEDADPSRLGRAQAELGALLDRLRGDRVGLVIFARRPFVRSPMTSDIDTLRRLIDHVENDRALVPPGSDLGAAIQSGRELVLRGDADTKALLIVSDGEDHGASVDAAVAEARSEGVYIYTAGAGTAEGATVRVVDAETGAVSVRTDATGAPAVTRLDEDALKTMAAAGNGRYIALAGSGRPLAALASELETLDSTVFATEEHRDPIERFQWFAAIALLLLACEVLLTDGLLRHESMRAARRLWPVGAAALFAGAICSTSAADLNDRGNDEYASARYDAAIERYGQAQALDPNRPELHYNAGNAYDRSGSFDLAVDESSRALASDDPVIEAQAEYAIGNHHFGAGRLEEAREAFKRALLVDPGDADAKHNLEVIERLLQPTPTPTNIPPPTQVPGPEGPEGEPGDPSGEDGQPSAGGTPQAGGPTPAPGDISPEELQRLLEEALNGIDSEFTVEEALHALDLLAERNRTTAQEGEAAPGGASGPDW